MITQDDIRAGIEAAQSRYAAVGHRESSLNFSHEVQGFIADQVQRGLPLTAVLRSVIELLRLVAKANGQQLPETIQ